MEDSFRAGLNEWKAYEHHCNQTTQVIVTLNSWILMSLGFRAQASCVKVEVAVLGSQSLIKPYVFLWNQ